MAHAGACATFSIKKTRADKVRILADSFDASKPAGSPDVKSGAIKEKEDAYYRIIGKKCRGVWG